jgi:hypothetical protein
MTVTRRQLTWTLTAAAGAVGLFGASIGFAQDDDDDGRPENMFISPAGQPFRAPRSAPYPVSNWFKQADKNGDGKLDHAEFMADAEAFFKVLDLNGDGVLDGYEIQVYERRIVPEILGYRVNVGALGPGAPLAMRRAGARLWLAQGGPPPGPAGPSDDEEPQDHPPKGLDESQQGASPYGFFNAPEPVTAADPDFRGLIYKANFLKLADRHFGVLDQDSQGFLTLAKLPKTEIQKAIEKLGHRRS